MSDDTFVPSFPPSTSISPQLCDMQIDVGGLQQLQLCLCKIAIFVYVSVFMELCFLLGFSQRFPPIGFFLCFFPWLVLGSTFLNLVIVCAPSSVLCVLCFVIMTFSSGVHRPPYIILADACVPHISCG